MYKTYGPTQDYIAVDQAPWTSPYDTGAYTNIRQRKRSGTQGRAPQALTLWNTNTISAEQNTTKDQKNSMHATEVCEHAIIFWYNNLICP